MELKNLRQTLAAQALKRQMERAIKAESAPFKPPAMDAGRTARQARERFEAMPQYQQIKIMQVGGDKLGVASPFFRVHEGIAGATTRIGGRAYINYSSYNYLGMSGDPLVSARAKEAIDQYGTSASASRAVAGERPIHRQLERALADFYEAEDCVVFVSGYATNVAAVSYLFGPGDLIVHDELAHNSIAQGAQLSGAKRLIFPHNDWNALDALLRRARREYRHALIAIEGIYSMDGDLPDLERFVEVKTRHEAFLMVDEAHSLGVLGRTGRGIREHTGVPPGAIDLWMGTLSKTLAGCGGFIAGCQPMVEMLRASAPGFMYSVGIPPALAAASLAALERLQAEPERIAALQTHGKLFLDAARAAGLNTGASAGYSVIPVITGSSLKAVHWSNALFEQGINVQPIFYPAVEEKTARLRFFICSTHQPEQIEHTIKIMAQLAQ
ncbi:MAG: aminotransferase class I/II-fold pyridoxal phosphate-dependent enzyme [Burkholderiaceae bacterium]|jgi:8-amino-7-oxononanoate synthase|nr:aminotransferase class I/II-fold pyridoxal phosphate-dependent enzyme [Burkholderiaceae bacterium]